MKNLIINEVKGLYTKNYKMLLKEIKDMNKWDDIPVFMDWKTSHC